ncbi:MAG: hypothetical protein H6998_18970 [Hahellaceae bacterium]|nr:hypothetical protein [Hahellaceae bacterium]
MDKDTKLLFGKILGEIYRIQMATDGVACPSSPGQVFGLLNGFELAVEQEIERMGFISKDQVKAVMDVLDPIWMDQEKLANFKGFYDIEDELNRKGVDRGEAIQVLTYLKANNQFEEVIEKMDSSGSPSECRRFELSEWDS